MSITVIKPKVKVKAARLKDLNDGTFIQFIPSDLNIDGPTFIDYDENILVKGIIAGRCAYNKTVKVLRFFDRFGDDSLHDFNENEVVLVYDYKLELSLVTN